jgi:hypothetical protein
MILDVLTVRIERYNRDITVIDLIHGNHYRLPICLLCDPVMNQKEKRAF